MPGERLYTVKEVSALTGVPPATLRKWEERYGVVQPRRLPNGYRGYGEREIRTLIWVCSRVRAGAMVSLVADNLRRRLAEGWTPPPTGGSGLPGLKDRLLHRFTTVDGPGANQVLDEALGTLSVEVFLLDLIVPVLYHLGDLWAEGRISEYQESFASALVRERLAVLKRSQPQLAGPHLLSTCVPGEQHELGALILSLLALRQGFRVTHLSATQSPEGLIRALGEIRPDYLCLSVTTRSTLARAVPHLAALAEAARAMPVPPLLVLGGQGVAGYTDPIPGFLIRTGPADRVLGDLLNQK